MNTEVYQLRKSPLLSDNIPRKPKHHKGILLLFGDFWPGSLCQ